MTLKLSSSREPETIEDLECAKLWPGENPLKMNLDIGVPQDPRAWAKALFSSLFFVESDPGASSEESTRFVLRSRVASGAHLQRIIMSVRHHAIHIHYKTVYVAGKHLVCDSGTWSSFLRSNVFSRCFDVEPHLAPASIQFLMDNPFVPGQRDSIQGPSICPLTPPGNPRRGNLSSQCQSKTVDSCMVELFKELDSTLTLLGGSSSE